MKRRWLQLALELTAWAFFLLFPIMLFPSLRPFYKANQINPVLTGMILTNSLLIFFYYINLHFIIPKFYFTGYYKQFTAIVASCLLLITLLLLVNPQFNPLPTPPFENARLAYTGSIVIRFLMVFLFSLGMASLNRLYQAQKEKITSELALLRAQVNPHFLFNTLNSIYALTVTKNDKAPNAVSQLAAIMRYSLESAKQEIVSLHQELDHLAAYVELERIRLNEKTVVNYKVIGQPDPHQIAPMILLPLVENCFKHGISTRDKSKIDITIKIEDNYLAIQTCNRLYKHDHSGGNGLNNLSRRMEMLYPGKYRLRHAETNGFFIAELNVQL